MWKNISDSESLANYPVIMKALLLEENLQPLITKAA